jgi:hypothetical protein
MPIERKGVSSTCLRNTGYDPENKTLDLEFRKGGAVYEYFDVPKRTHTGLRKASSVGRYFNKHVRNEFDFRKIRGGHGRKKRRR